MMLTNETAMDRDAVVAPLNDASPWAPTKSADTN